MIGYLDAVARSLVLIFPKIRGYVMTIQNKGGDNNKNNKLMSSGIDDIYMFLIASY